MPHPDEIEYANGECAYLWVRSKSGSWDEVDDSLGRRSHPDEWRPAMLTGICDPADRGTQLDQRRLVFIGCQYHYRLEQFEFGNLLGRPTPVPQEDWPIPQPFF